MIFVYIFLLVFFIVIAYVLIAGKSRYTGDFTNPLFLYFVYFPITYFGLPSIQMFTSSFRYNESYSDVAYFLSMLYLLIFSFFVFVTYIIITDKLLYNDVRNVFDVKKWINSDGYAVKLILILILLPVSLVIVYFINYIQKFGYEQYLANRIILLSGKGYLTTLLLWVIPLVVFFVALIIKNNEKEKRGTSPFNYILLLLVSLIPGIILGSRTNLLLPYLFIILSIAILKTKGKLANIKKMLKLITPIFLLAVIGFWLEGYRQSLMSGQSVESANLITQVSGGFGTSENLYWWFDHAEGKRLYGSTLISILVGFIPRSIWPDKPYGGGPALVNTMYPGRYNQTTGENISSYTTGFPFEFMMNFGFVGSIIGGIIFGILLALVYYLRGKIVNSIQFSIWLMVMFCVFSLLHGEVFGITAKLVGLVFPLLIVKVFGKIKRGKEYEFKKRT